MQPWDQLRKMLQSEFNPRDRDPVRNPYRTCGKAHVNDLFSSVSSTRFPREWVRFSSGRTS